MFYVCLKQIESSHNNVRTSTINGLAPQLPVVGTSFFMYSNETLTPSTNMRFVNTSEIQEVRVNEENGDIVFRTHNSLYVLTNIRRADPLNESKDGDGLQ